jgi:L-lactate dehydrogenase complex protein LldE
VIVTPSGSCAALIRHDYPKLFENDDMSWRTLANRAASITWEMSEYLVEGLGITDIGAKLPQPETFAVHDACHGLRLLGLGKAGRTLIENVENASLEELAECDVCCGFGGLFAVKMAAVSNAMLEKKIENINASDGQTIVTGDVSCLTQMNGGLSRNKSPKRVKHLADVLAKGLD